MRNLDLFQRGLHHGAIAEIDSPFECERRQLATGIKGVISHIKLGFSLIFDLFQFAPGQKYSVHQIVVLSNGTDAPDVACYDDLFYFFGPFGVVIDFILNFFSNQTAGSGGNGECVCCAVIRVGRVFSLGLRTDGRQQQRYGTDKRHTQ